MRLCNWCNCEVESFGYRRRTYCSRACNEAARHSSIEDRKARLRQATQEKPPHPPISCSHCGDEFIPKGSNAERQRSCSRNCSYEFHKAESRRKTAEARAQVIKQCPICDVSFSPKRTMKEIYCSKKCRECIGKKVYKMMQLCYEGTKTKKSQASNDVLGYTPEDLLKHLETFPNWNDLKNGSWHLDHKFPIVAFVHAGIADIQVICCLENLQPLTGEENMAKGGVYDPEEFKAFLVKHGFA